MIERFERKPLAFEPGTKHSYSNMGFVLLGRVIEIATGIDESIPTTGHIISAYALGVVIGAPVITALTGLVPRRRLLLLLMLAFTVGHLIAALAAKGTSQATGIEIINRGYEKFMDKLTGLGADVELSSISR